MSSLQISEIFHSIQGEGVRAGCPCVFVRLSGCDVGCVWCDTPHAKDPADGTSMTIDAILSAVAAYPCRLVQITGGEPLLQDAAPTLAARLVDAGYTVLVETSGTRDIAPFAPPVVRIMDIKTPSSGASGRMWWPNLGRLRAGDEVKFVVADRADYEWARGVMARTDYPGEVVTTLFGVVEGRLAASELADWMLSDGVRARLQVQLHRILWPGEDRGV